MHLLTQYVYFHCLKGECHNFFFFHRSRCIFEPFLGPNDPFWPFSHYIFFPAGPMEEENKFANPPFKNSLPASPPYQCPLQNIVSHIFVTLGRNVIDPIDPPPPVQSWKMSNLLHGSISTNQILPREKRVNRNILALHTYKTELLRFLGMNKCG